jgi:hypothetical protein
MHLAIDLRRFASRPQVAQRLVFKRLDQKVVPSALIRVL